MVEDAGSAGAEESQGAEPSRGETESGADDPEALAQLESRARLADEYLGQLQRLKADFDNFRKRMTQEQARWADAAVGRFLGELLPVVDNLERAIEAGGETEAVRRGVELTLRQMNELLARAGVETLQPVGAAFDPTFHEAMGQVETSDVPDGQVIEELRRGYLFKRQVLRPSMVRVARSPAGHAEQASEVGTTGREAPAGSLEADSGREEGADHGQGHRD